MQQDVKEKCNFDILLAENISGKKSQAHWKKNEIKNWHLRKVKRNKNKTIPLMQKLPF